MCKSKDPSTCPCKCPRKPVQLHLRKYRHINRRLASLAADLASRGDVPLDHEDFPSLDSLSEEWLKEEQDLSYSTKVDSNDIISKEMPIVSPVSCSSNDSDFDSLVDNDETMTNTNLHNKDAKLGS
ncbi:hypothetical protein FDP41_000707 [Naegleria fowleri]|uniref:Uncharacterized protein n=1 Tax=Naegleria fowleri TaxID=5763 RepID=A0A6A5CHU5_NAEFO|nr:uncharacterized protein FDP41_000707 [Naegleria fowleri]KAF0984808.1 hypothetical protein FDP41_000707 [Naegleria fowleri]CAG4708654.1 unnamed protein product [Naegleria fowleri]